MKRMGDGVAALAGLVWLLVGFLLTVLGED